MTLIVAGTVRVPPERIETFRPYMQAMIESTRQEAGCLEYSYAVDVLDPGLVRVFEVWRDHASLAAHFTTSHMVEWRSMWGNFGVSDRRLIAYEVASQDDM